MSKVRLRLRYGAMAAILAAPLALGLRAQNAPAQEAAPPQPAPQPPAAGAPAQPDQAQTPIFRTDINFVRVDVIVNDKQGNPVHDLRQEDFEVTEDGKPQAIQTFKLVKVSEDAGVGSDPPREVRNAIEEQAEAARDDVRLFAIFLDDYHVRLENSMRARELIAQFVENQLQPADMAGVMYPLFSITDVLLTRNRRNVATAIRGFQGRKYDYTPRNQFEENYVHYVSTIEAERIRNDVTLTALKALIIRLGGLREGRKAIILVTEGFTNVLPAQVNDMIATCNGGPCMNQPRPRPDPIAPNSPAQQRLESQEFFLQTSLLSDIRRVTELANRYNTAIYAIDPRGLAPFEFDLSTAGGANVSLTKDQQMLNSTIDTLRILADETDGRAIVNTNDLATGMRQIVRDQTAYYLLGYTSTLSEPDGKFHKINVRVKRPGVQVRARPGYLAMTAAEVERAVAPKRPGPPPAITEALGTLAVTAQQRRSLTRSWIGMSPGASGKTKISFVWSPTPATPDVRRETAAKVRLLAGGANSDLYFRRTVDPGRVEFEVPPGQVDLEIAVEDATGEVLDRETRKLDVPSLGLGLTISTPQVFRGRTLPEWQKLALDEMAVPAIEREFRRTDRLLVRVGAQSAAGAPVITARMLNREGGEMSTLAVQAAGFGGLSHIDVPLAALPAGEFLIEVTAKDGAEQAVSYIAVRVTP
jgi:VWFA-related protein